ncbi:MAG: FtsW/RodA/SpoVE family cell cycle protein [Microthrixaceae bacterium]
MARDAAHPVLRARQRRAAVSREAVDDTGRLLSTGIAWIITLQAFVNIAVTVGFAPSKGFTLPFISYGGSSMISMLAAVGLLLSVAREGRQARVGGAVNSV